MVKKYLIIEIDEEGNPKIDAKGFLGNECVYATQPYEEALGKVVKEKKKPEFYVEVEGNTKNKLKRKI